MNNIETKFYNAFIVNDRWMLYVKGLGVTLEIALFAGIIGIIIGCIVALMKLSEPKKGRKHTLWWYLATAYVDVIRGTPAVLQLLIMWFIVFSTSKNGVLVASLSFGINSGAYVSEIIRAGILAVDKGQTMWEIVLPQAFKNVLPPIGNEFITLIKETAIVGYVSLSDLTRAASQISSRTYEAFMPLIGAAVIYFILIKILTLLLEALERRMRRSDLR